MIKIIVKNLGSLFIISLFLLVGNFVFAGSVLGNLTDAAKGTGLEKNADLSTFVGSILAVILSLLGVVLVIMIIYAGILWGFLAKGESAQIKKAKDILINAVIGLIIVFASYSITNFIITALKPK